MPINRASNIKKNKCVTVEITEHLYLDEETYYT